MEHRATCDVCGRTTVISYGLEDEDSDEGDGTVGVVVPCAVCTDGAVTAILPRHAEVLTVEALEPGLK